MTWEDYEPLSAAIAAEYARKFRRYGAETADVWQELRLWLASHPGKLAEWEALEDEKATTKMVARTLRNHASLCCQELKAQVLGYSLRDLVWYARGELSVLLDHMFDQESWSNPPEQDGEKRRGGDPATGNNWLATLSDVSRAFDQLKDADRDLLYLYHRDGKTNVDLARRRGVSEQAQSRMHHRALGRLLDLLGGEKPRNTHDQTDCECSEYVGTRRVVSNAGARAMTENQYDED
ncbi:MAG TPA: hypothetical protein VFH56_14255 [Acidimicrobiales bacterium]|nr:hypothetical protein [Acidimicrobiales bacterium]